MSASKKPSSWALLVGIDEYKNIRCSRLNGCVSDVNEVEIYLNFRLEGVRITKILGTGKPESTVPDYDTVSKALREIEDQAQPSDIVYIHYSGHGGQQETRSDKEHPHKSSAGKFFEVLVLDGKHHFKDYWLGARLGKLAEKGVVLFVVLDCCHSGGADRTGNDSVRGLDGILPADEDDDGEEEYEGYELEQDIDKSVLENQKPLRDASSEACYWQRARNYSVLAACQPSQKARETTHKGKTNGVLTYLMLKSLKKLWRFGTIPTYRALHQDILASMVLEYPSQSCMLLGEQDRILFGKENVTGSQLGVVSKVLGSRVEMNIGEVVGVVFGEEYNVYRRGTSFDRSDLITTIKVNKVDQLHSSAENPVTNQSIQVGCPVKLLKPVVNDPLHVRIQSLELLNGVRQEMEENPVGLAVQLHPFRNDDWQYQVLTKADHYEITDALYIPMPGLPQIAFGGTAVGEIIRLLKALTRYQFAKQLYNPKSQLNESFSFQPSSDSSSEVFHNESITLELENKSTGPAAKILYVNLFDLKPDWTVKQLTSSPFELSPQDSEKLSTLRPELNMTVPDGCDHEEIKDILLAVITTRPVSLEGLATNAERSWEDDAARVQSLIHNLTEASREGMWPEFRDAYLQCGSGNETNGLVDDWQTKQIVITTKKPTIEESE